MVTVNCDYLLEATREHEGVRRRYCWKCSRCGHRVATHEPEPPVSKCQELHRPGLAEVGSFALSLFKLAAHGGMATGATVEKRLRICQQCDKFRPKQNRCNVCGCKVNDKSGNWLKNLTNKLAYPDQECPLGKWGPEGS